MSIGINLAHAPFSRVSSSGGAVVCSVPDKSEYEIPCPQEVWFDLFISESYKFIADYLLYELLLHSWSIWTRNDIL